MSALSGSSNHARERRRRGKAAGLMLAIHSRGRKPFRFAGYTYIYSDKLPQRPRLGKIEATPTRPCRRERYLSGRIHCRLIMRNALFATLIAIPSAAFAAQGHAHHPIGQAEFGRAGETSVQIYTLTNDHGIEARIMTYGAALVSLKTPDRAGNSQDILLGFDSV